MSGFMPWNQVLKLVVPLQILVLFLCATIFACFVYELAAVKPVWLDVAKGFIPTAEILTNSTMLYIAIGILGEHQHPGYTDCMSFQASSHGCQIRAPRCMQHGPVKYLHAYCHAPACTCNKRLVHAAQVPL